jgi:hypothetical protein
MKYIHKFNESQEGLSDMVKPQGYTKAGIKSAPRADQGDDYQHLSDVAEEGGKDGIQSPSRSEQGDSYQQLSTASKEVKGGQTTKGVGRPHQGDDYQELSFETPETGTSGHRGVKASPRPQQGDDYQHLSHGSLVKGGSEGGVKFPPRQGQGDDYQHLSTATKKVKSFGDFDK